LALLKDPSANTITTTSFKSLPANSCLILRAPSGGGKSGVVDFFKIIACNDLLQKCDYLGIEHIFLYFTYCLVELNNRSLKSVVKKKFVLITKEEPGCFAEAKSSEPFQTFLKSYDAGMIGDCAVSYLSKFWQSLFHFILC
jgi:hypothetical protein